MITAPGIGSGLDVNGIVTQLMELERQPIEALERKQGQLEAQLSAYGKLKSSLSSFQDAMQELSTLDAFKNYAASSNNEALLMVEAGATAAPGNYTINVNRLAEHHKMNSSEFLDTDTFGGNAGDALSIQVGADPANTISVDLSTARTLGEIRDAINSDANNPGVSATIINGNDGNQKLVLTADDSGQASALTLTYAGTLDDAAFGFQTINDIGGDLSLLDAEVAVDGYVINRSGNTISDVISGVTLDLKKAEPGTDIQISIDRDLEATRESVQAFADAYNELRSSIKSLRSGQLEADGSLLQMERQLLNVMNNPPTEGVFKHLSEVGVSVQKDGTLTVNDTRLNSALENDFSGVAELFAKEGTGYARRFDDLVEGWLGVDGLVQSRTDGLDARIERFEDRQIAMERRLEQVEARYLAQFSALDSLMSQLQGMSSYLSQQLAALPGAQQ